MSTATNFDTGNIQASATDTILAIGAFTGGLRAVCKLAAELPAAFPAPIAVVVHTGMDSPRLLVSIIEANTDLRAKYATERVNLHPGRSTWCRPASISSYVARHA